MATKFEEFVYTFGELVLVGHRPYGREHTTWYLECPECHGKHQFKKCGSKIWHTSCWVSGMEWTITPKEYYVQKPLDFTKILGDV